MSRSSTTVENNRDFWSEGTTPVTPGNPIMPRTLGEHIVDATFTDVFCREYTYLNDEGKERIGHDVTIGLILILFDKTIAPHDLMQLRFVLTVPAAFGPPVEIEMVFAGHGPPSPSAPYGSIIRRFTRMSILLKPADSVKEEDFKDRFACLLADAKYTGADWFQMIEKLIIRHAAMPGMEYEIANDGFQPPKALDFKEAAGLIAQAHAEDDERDSTQIIFDDDESAIIVRTVDLTGGARLAL